MATNAFFPKAIEKDPNKFTKKTREEKSRHGTRQFTDYCLLGESVFPCSEGYHLVYYGEDRLTLPEDLEHEVAYYSVSARLPSWPRRARGVYRLPGDDAVEAELDTTGSKDLEFRGRHRSVEKLYELLRLVRAGTIRPVENWDAEQIEGASTVTQLNNELARLRLRVGEIGSRQDGFELDLGRLRQAEADRFRPFLHKLQDRMHKMMQTLRNLASKAAWRRRDAAH